MKTFSFWSLDRAVGAAWTHISDTGHIMMIEVLPEVMLLLCGSF